MSQKTTWSGVHVHFSLIDLFCVLLKTEMLNFRQNTDIFELVCLEPGVSGCS